MISARAAYFKRTSVQKFDKPVARTKRQLSLRGTLSVQFRRIDVGDADFLAIKPDCVAVMNAVVPGTGRTHSKSGSNQEHVTGLTALS
tara:strand:- start:6460 stop:6723 length:264 start_codon:yes stop_codon:yes gene_type:complete